MTKKLIVVTMNTTISDCHSRATICRRIRRCESASAEADPVAIDALCRIDRPAAHVDGPAVRAREANVDPPIDRTDHYDVIKPDRRDVVGDRLEGAPGNCRGFIRIERRGGGVEQRVDLRVRVTLDVLALIADR